MNEQKEMFNFDFDIKNNRELSPSLFFSDTAIFSLANYYFTNHRINFFSEDYKTKTILSILNEDINSKNKNRNKKNSIFKKILLSQKDPKNSPFVIENKSSILINLIEVQQKSLFSFISFLNNKIEKKLMQQPIPKCLFPCYLSKDYTISIYSEEHLHIYNESKLKTSIGLIENKIRKTMNEKNVDYDYLKVCLIDIKNILEKNLKSFSFSSNLIQSALNMFDDILNTLYSPQDFEFFYENIQSKCYVLILLVNMQFYMMIHQMHNFLSNLIKLFSIIQENPEIENDEPFDDLEKAIQNAFPKCTTSRSIIIKDLTYDQILDFCFSNDEKNDFILTKKGIFKVENKETNKNNIYEFNNLELVRSHIKINFSFIRKNEAKIAYANGILYVLFLNNKTIYRIKVSPDEEMEQKRYKIMEKIKKFKDNSKYRIRKVLLDDIKKVSAKRTIEEKKDRKKKRKLEKFKEEDEYIDLNNVKIDIFDLPIISMGAYNNYIRLIQQISYNDGENYFIFTNIDLIPDCRTNFIIEDMFNKKQSHKHIKQTQNKVIIKDKDMQYKIQNILFSCDYMLVCFEDSSIEQYIILNDGTIEFSKRMISPLISFSNTIFKLDNKMFLYYLEQVTDHNYNQSAVSITKMYLPETKYWFREENKIFLKYPYLKNLSNIVNNCSQFILNQKIESRFYIDDYMNTKTEKENSPMMIVSPKEMSSVIQSPNSIVSQLSYIKELLFDMEDDNLKKLFAPMLIKLCGINIYYEINQYMNCGKINENIVNIFQSFKEFIVDLYYSLSHSDSIEFDIILSESIIFTISICGKYLFYPDSFNELHDLTNQILCDDYNYYSKLLLKLFSSVLFEYPSSLYFFDQSIYQKLIEFQNDINIHDLFMRNIIYILMEIKFSHQIMNDEFIQFISPYIDALFSHIKYVITNEKVSFNIVKQILAYIFGYDFSNAYFSLSLHKKLIEICPYLYKKITSNNDVAINEKEFQELNNNADKQIIDKETKIVESEHPFIIDESLADMNNIIEISEKIEFDPNIDKIYVEFDNRCHLYDNYQIIFNPKICTEPIIFDNANKIKFNSIYKIKANKINIKIKINLKDYLKSKQKLWGYKIKFTGIHSENPFYWIPNSDLNFYDNFVSFITRLHCHSYESIKYDESENTFKIYLKNKIIQGIKIEDINKEYFDDISTGIYYDSTKQYKYQNEVKKQILIDLITLTDEHFTPIKNCIDAIYSSTSKQNKVNLNILTKSILINEHYLIACLLKHLGLISEFIELSKNINSSDNIEIPNFILLIWKKAYELRNNLYYRYQKTKVINTNSQQEPCFLSYEDFLKETKNKCKILLYSYPILMLTKDIEISYNLLNETANIIYSFITSNIKVSDISDFIDKRQKRLSISNQSITDFSLFIDQNDLFESSKYAMISFYNVKSPYSKCKGAPEYELDEYEKLTSQFSINLLQKVLENSQIDVIIKSHFLTNLAINNTNDFSNIQISKKAIELLENFSDNNLVSFHLIHIIIQIVMKTKNIDLFKYLLSLLSFEKTDIKSKQLILMSISYFSQMIPESIQFLDEQLTYSILNKNKFNPTTIQIIFCLIASIFKFNNKNASNSYEFIMKIIKGIGQSFVGKSCLFIDDSFQKFSHRQVAESMITFIRLLFNNENENLFLIIHNILNKSIKNIEIKEEKFINDDIFITIGLFESIGYTISSFESNRKFTFDNFQNSNILIEGYNPTLKEIQDNKGNIRNINGSFTNSVIIDPKKMILDEKEIENLLKINKSIIDSKYFNCKNEYESKIEQKEITENILITSFYSFLPIIFQNENNASILFNKFRINDILSLFEISKNVIPSNENSIPLLSHYLENAILSPLYNDISDKSYNDFQFVKINYGEINNDLIKSNANFFNIFMGNRPFNSNCETYFVVQIKKIGLKNVFIGIVNSEDTDINKMIGFGCLGHSNVFCRRSPYLSNDINIDGDKVMDIQIKEGDLIGCYCTKDYLYFTLNGILTQFRISYMTLKTYIPIICIDHDDIELKIFKNISIIDHSNKKYDFLNTSKYCSKYFQGKDIDSSVQIKKEDDTNNSFIEQNNFLIGQIVKLNQMNINEFDIESNYIQPQSFQYYQESFGIIKDINTGNGNKYVSKMTIESFNNIKLSKETINFDIDSRFLAKQKTNFFNLIENRMNVKFGFNSAFDLDYLPEKLQKSCDLNSIKLFLKNKTINDNSKSISILMVRYLVFILVDFLRYSKSTLLQEIDSKESQSIIQYLAYSLPTITVFNPVFEFSIDDITINNYLIFPDKNFQRFSCKIPGLSSCFHYSFIAFLKKGTNIISQEFMLDLIQNLFDIKNQNNSNSLSIFYDMIASKYKIESLFPLPRKFYYKLEIEKLKFYDEANQNDVVGFIPILLSTIPDELPCVICGKRGLRISSNKISYFAHINQDFSIKWKYDIEKLKEIELSEINVKDFNDFKLQLGIFLLNYNLQENLLNGILGFVQIIFILFHSFINLKKNKNLIKSIIEKLFIISQEKNALVNPFLKEIFVYFIIQEGFSDLFLTKEASNFFSNLSIKDNPYQIDKYNNKSSIIFNLFSNLFNIRETELSITNNKNEEELSLLFDKYYEINNELFEIYNDDIEDNYLKIEGKMKESDLFNYQIFYFLFYYSILLRRENITPYPMFLFVHEYIRQHFGGFSFKVNHKNYNNDDSNEILYHSDMLLNNFDLECSFKLINSYGYELDYYKYDIFVQQNEDNKKIELIEGEKVFVSFPLDILIKNKRQKETKLKNGDTFIINFEPSKEQQKKYFITHYDEILEAFKQYISLEKYDNDLSQYLFSLKKKREFPYYNDDVFSFPSVGNHLYFEGNDNFENLYEENNQHDILDPNELNVRLFNEITRMFNTHRLNHANLWNISHHLIDFDNSNFQINTEFKYIFTHQKIPKVIDIKLKDESFNQLIISLRYYILASYIRFIKKLMKNEDFFNSDSLNALSIWDISISDKKDTQNFYINQIIHPLYSLDTKIKFKFIQKYIENNTKNTSKLSINMNRFEQQKFKNAIENNNKEQIIKESSLPLLFQFMKQVDEESLYRLKIPNNTPFSVKLIGENAIDAGGPGREIFSSLMIEMMNNHIGIFAFNPNRQHNIKETNQEDLIPFVNANCYDESLMKQFSNRFVYAGSLIAVCITSKLPQPIKLSSIIWEYLTHESVSIESIYEIDYNFKKLIENAENAFNKANASDLSKEEFESLFLHAFDINDSFDNIIELIPSGSNQLVTKENLKNFIQLAKNFRIHEFDQQLIDLKKGFDIVMCNKNITSILNPNELKLFVCGEPNCDIEQMKQLIRVSVATRKDVDKEKIIQMFWNVIESFSVEERMKFIRFSSGNLGLPAPGLKWNDYLNVNIVSLFYRNKLAHASTCSSTITIPLFENEEELDKILRISIENSFLITDSRENFEIISEFL